MNEGDIFITEFTDAKAPDFVEPVKCPFDQYITSNIYYDPIEAYKSPNENHWDFWANKQFRTEIGPCSKWCGNKKCECLRRYHKFIRCNL